MSITEVTEFIVIKRYENGDLVGTYEQQICCVPCVRRVYEQMKVELGGHK